MIDCGKISAQLLDLIFDELPASEQPIVLAHLADCQQCQAEHRQLQASLDNFDQFAEALTPSEDFWPGYQERLQANLTKQTSPLARSLRSFSTVINPGWFALAAGLALLITISALLVSGNNRSNSITNLIGEVHPGIKLPTPTTAKPTTPAETVAETVNKPKSTIVVDQQHHTKRPRQLQIEPAPRQIEEQTTPPTLIARAIFDPQTSHHLEMSVLLLRSFKNSLLPNENSDLAFQREQAQRLLYKNIWLRRDAEAKGELPAINLLNRLEPFLIDIANLSEQPAAEEIEAIQHRIRDTEITTIVQIYNAQLSPSGY